MTWSYYTDFLDGSRPITKAERDELYDNLQTLLTGDCSAGGQSLDTDAMTAIKASRFITDRASLDGVTAERLHDVLESISGIFANYTSAVSAALAGEGISSVERDELLDASADDRRLWNYYRRLIGALSCSCAWGGGSGSGFGDFSDSYDVTGFFEIDRDVTFDATVFELLDEPTTRLRVYADGVAVYDSGCVVEPDAPGAVFTIPAGTTEIVVELVTCSGPTGSEYVYSIGCAT